MERLERAPNRLLDLDELESPGFRRTLMKLDALVARDDISYLHPSKRWEYPWSLERAELRPGERVLDAGCGDSIFPVYLAHQRLRVTGVDVKLDGRLGRMHGVRVDYVRGDLTGLPFRDAAFDAVFCISVIEHLPEPQIRRALDELWRVLRPRGRLLLTTDYYEDADAEIRFEYPGEPGYRIDWQVFDEKRLRRLLLSAPGFRVDGDTDVAVDWPAVRRQMRAFHGFPYTAFGVKLVRES